MAQGAKALVDKVISTTPKPLRTILDDMYLELENNKERYNRNMRNLIPTTNELRTYLSRNYSKVRLNEAGQPVKSRLAGEMHYYKE